MAITENASSAREALEPQLESLISRKGLTQALLESAECYYASDDGDNLLAEYPNRWQRSRVPGQPLLAELGPSSMRDGERALVVTW